MVRTIRIIVILSAMLVTACGWRMKTTGTAKKDLGNHSKTQYEGKVEVYKDIAIEDLFKGEKTDELE